jgi:Ca2+-transporting ATPase
VASTLEIEEAALTGESQPATKRTDAVDRDEVSLGDRQGMAYMNTQVTRGRAELVVTATGMRTEIGRIAGLLRSTDTERTPLQQQLDGLAHSLAKLAGVIVAAVFVIGLLKGDSVSDLLLTAVALAVAAIPEALPIVAAVALALGAGAMGPAAAATGTVAHWAADRTTAAPPLGTCSGRSAGGGGGEAARVMRATMLPRMVRQE